MTGEVRNGSPIEERDAQGRVKSHRWPLPTDGPYLRDFLTDIFEHYWDRISFGPILDGVAFEWSCAAAPDRIEYEGGYLTIGFGGPHFHLCLAPPGGVADSRENAPRLRRLPGAASLFRALDPHGAPNSWGFDLRNRGGDPLLSIYFANPFALPGDRLTATPDWSRLAMWHDISRRYLGRAPDPFDRTGTGFVWATAA
jgi:hypothetical protein